MVNCAPAGGITSCQGLVGLWCFPTSWAKGFVGGDVSAPGDSFSPVGDAPSRAAGAAGEPADSSWAGGGVPRSRCATGDLLSNSATWQLCASSWGLGFPSRPSQLLLTAQPGLGSCSAAGAPPATLRGACVRPLTAIPCQILSPQPGAQLPSVPVLPLVRACVAVGWSRVTGGCRALPALCPLPPHHLRIKASNQPSSTGLNLKFLPFWEAERQTNIFSTP